MTMTKPKEPPVHRGWDITKNAFAEIYYISDGRITYEGGKSEEEARTRIDAHITARETPTCAYPAGCTNPAVSGDIYCADCRSAVAREGA